MWKLGWVSFFARIQLSFLLIMSKAGFVGRFYRTRTTRGSFCVAVILSNGESRKDEQFHLYSSSFIDG